MASKSSKNSGLRYGMTGFAHARQPAGAHPVAIVALKEGGNIREAASPPAAPLASESPALGPVVDTTATEVRTVAQDSHTVAPAEPAIRSETPTSAAKQEQASVGTSRRRGRRASDEYKLPPRGAAKQRPRSHHFRFPEKIDVYLNTLAEAFDCTRTHVVCSAIRSEWQRLRRKQAKDAKKASTSH
ncbi:hypothetical protein SAMN02745121_03334 [Nannocystis exedens]|uniref:Uncharacterized protein n=1 Tax=Nannocystis exedens TaxID=54 RepID=A0A1I1YIX1_9BACT|nr:hypothetical protein [Nannocystis exedens]PCC70337.1 hypothetical protein NAEX_03380 [Nannocystis exedens]SFE19507.1 hypothetical protein SAMN02745121_03334 [Nannocystis exedens]